MATEVDPPRPSWPLVPLVFVILPWLGQLLYDVLLLAIAMTMPGGYIETSTYSHLASIGSAFVALGAIVILLVWVVRTITTYDSGSPKLYGCHLVAQGERLMSTATMLGYKVR